MIKTIIQGSILVLLFFTTWFLLSQVDWVTLFKIQKVTDNTEKKLGDLFWEIFQKSERENKKPFVIQTVDSVVSVICKANEIDRKSVKVHILHKSDINAFALPNGHLVVYSGLILNAGNPEELSGVISHEIAHMELNHVMKKLVREVGLSTLVSMASGNGGTEIIKATAKILSSTAFDRAVEKEADIRAVDYLVRAKINPESFANFLYKFSTKESGPDEYLDWVSTHPDSRERAGYIIEYIQHKKGEHKAVLSFETWTKLKKELTEYP